MIYNKYNNKLINMLTKEDGLKTDTGDASLRRDQKLNEKIDKIILLLKKKGIFNDEEAEDIMRIAPVGVTG